MAVAARGGGDEGFGELTSLLGGLLEGLRINFIGGAFLPFDCDCEFPSDDVADLGRADCPPSVVVEGDSTPDVPVALPSRFCASVTLIFGRAASDMA